MKKSSKSKSLKLLLRWEDQKAEENHSSEEGARIKDALERYRAANKYGEDMTKFARGICKEQLVRKVMKFAHVRSLQTYESKNRLLDRFKAAGDAAIEYRDAIEEESGIEDARNNVIFDSVWEDESGQDIVGVLDMLLNAKVENNKKGELQWNSC